MAVADGRVIQESTPAALVAHAATDVEPLIAPCLLEMGLSRRIAEVASQWREHSKANPPCIHPIFVGTGTVANG